MRIDKPLRTLSFFANEVALQGSVMKTHGIDSFGPEGVKLISQAFDEAWEYIAGSFEESPAVQKSARSKLADAVLSIAAKGITDIEVLKTEALQTFMKDWEQRGTLPKVSIR